MFANKIFANKCRIQMNGWIISYFDLPTLCCRLLRYLGFVPRTLQVCCRGLSEFALVEVQLSEMRSVTLLTHPHPTPCRKYESTPPSTSTTPSLLFWVSQSSPYPVLPVLLAFLFLQHTLPAWPPNRVLSFSWLLPSLSLLQAGNTACSLQGEWQWSNCGYKSLLQVTY